ncbi:14573_t:CDS:1, partial [Gigaspora rosea]
STASETSALNTIMDKYLSFYNECSTPENHLTNLATTPYIPDMTCS